jgi:bifunctional DNase/RNase
MRNAAICLWVACLILWGCSSGWAGSEEVEVREVEILGVAAEGTSRQPYVVLREKGGPGVVEIFIGPAEAQAIALALNQQVTPRPLTHDLMISILRDLNVRLKEVLIHDLRENTYYAWLYLETGDGRELRLDSRPSDGIALALRAGAPIIVQGRLLKRAASKTNSRVKPSHEDCRPPASSPTRLAGHGFGFRRDIQGCYSLVVSSMFF